MTALDIITLEQAKEYLEIDFPDYDEMITRNIRAAVEWVENYTGYRLYQRNEEFYMDCGRQVDIYAYPLSVTDVVNDNDDSVSYKITRRTMKIIVSAPSDSTVKATVGYESAADVPGPLLAACYKLITYLQENRDAYTMGLPTDVQGLINQYRRYGII